MSSEKKKWTKNPSIDYDVTFYSDRIANGFKPIHTSFQFSNRFPILSESTVAETQNIRVKWWKLFTVLTQRWRSQLKRFCGGKRRREQTKKKTKKNGNRVLSKVSVKRDKSSARLNVWMIESGSQASRQALLDKTWIMHLHTLAKCETTSSVQPP